ncbi:hypothetical protein MKW94_025395, partial [Papaver nudicaule]|nr:hypothetical protein [Papaver nudicaule]
MGIGMVGSATSGRIQPPPSDSTAIPTPQIGVPRSDYQTPPPTTGISAAVAAGISFSSNTSSSSGDSDSDEDLDEGGGPSSNPADTRKRKRGGSGGGGGGGVGGSTSHRMMYFFEGLMKQVMEKQEAMQQRFLETIEKREQDRMIREEAWKRQEMARLTREHEMMAQERAISASRDAAVIAFLQKITGQTIQLPSPPVIIPAAPPPAPVQAPPPPQPQSILPPAAPAPSPPPPQPKQQKQHQHHQLVRHQPQPPPQKPPQSSEITITHHNQPTSAEHASTDHVIIAVPEQQHPPALEMGSSGGFDSASSRWPKTEVLALIKLRSGLESRYQEAGPKGPLWEEISAGMGRMGYSRSAKRCKEKWENINKYFKKVKESNKKRPEDAKTCPYFHQLDALYRKKVHGGSSQTNQESPIEHNQSSNTSSSSADPNQTSANLQTIMAPPLPPPQTNTNESAETNIKNSNNGGGGSNIEGAAASVAKK